VGKKVSGALAGARDEAPTPVPAAGSEGPVSPAGQTGGAGDLPTHDLPTHDLPTHDLPTHDLPTHDLPTHDLPTHDLEAAVSTASTKSTETAGDAVDPVCGAAVDVARTAALEVAGDAVGEHLGVEADGPRVLTHSFRATQPGYVGWRWAVTVARAEDSDDVTVDEVVMLPGLGALVAPPWVPWSERVQPGDLAPGDLLPSLPDDPRLVPAYTDPETETLLFEVGTGLGRERALSHEGRLDTAERWYDGTAGPDAPIAKTAPAPCSTCGFLEPLGGSLRQAFGVCANAYAPDDGRVVSLDHGCGAHSEVVAEPAHATLAGMVVEDDEFELVPAEPVDPS